MPNRQGGSQHEQFPRIRDTNYFLPPSLDGWLPQRHLPRFAVEVMTGLICLR
jgi:hypothetical protein